MLRRMVLRPYVLRSSSVWRPTPACARYYGDKASDIRTADRMEDREANQVQLEQVSKQMEDAIVKEKQVHDTEQKAKKLDQTWDTSSETVRKPEDPFMQQSKSQELGEIRKEQKRLTDNETLGGFEHTPQGREATGSSQNMSTAKISEAASNAANTVVEKVKQTMSHTTENVQQIGKSVMSMSHDLAESAKHSMQNVRENVGEGMKNVRQGMSLPENAKNYKKRQGLLKGMGEDVRHASQVTMEDLTEAAKKAMSSSPEARAARHEALAKEEEETSEETTSKDDKNKPRSKQFSENKQNSSLL